MAIASTFQEIQNDVATQMNLPPQETIVKSLNRYKRKFANALPHIPHRKDFQFPEEFIDFVAFDKGKDGPYSAFDERTARCQSIYAIV